MRRLKYVFYLLVMVLLAGCKAEIVEINLTDTQIYAAARGENSDARFKAVFANVGTLDADARQKIKQITDIIAEYFDDVETELEKTSTGYKFVVSGLLPVLGAEVKIKAPWFVGVQPSDEFGPDYYILQVDASVNYTPFNDAISKINFLLAPDAAQPIKFRLKGDNFGVIAPAVQINGESYLVYPMSINGRVSLVFKGGVFDQIGAGFFFKNQPE